MKRNPLLPLTETTYYIMLALQEPAHGYLIMQQVEEMSMGMYGSQLEPYMVQSKTY